MKKKIVSVLMAAALSTALLAGCGGGNAASTTSSSAAEEADEEEGDEAEADADEAEADTDEAEAEVTGDGIDVSEIKVGAIYIGDENEGYTEAHMKGIQNMVKNLGLSEDQLIEKTNIPEDESCYDAAVDLAESGCNIIFANSFGHETFMMQAAEEYPDIQFCHATGYQAASSGLPNMHNFFTAIYQSRYVSGVVAGLKLNEMIENGEITEEDALIGYVGAFPFAEVISGFTSFYLGARSVCPSAEMLVQYTNSWANLALEGEVARKLVADGCVLISQHADTTGAPTACQDLGVPCVGYNVSMINAAPDVALTSATMEWGIYHTYAVQCVIDGVAIDTDWAQGYPEGADKITELNSAVIAEGTEEAVADVEAQLKAGTLNVFDTSTFTVDGKTLEEMIEEGGDNAKYADYVSDGYFHESELASAPAFDLIIDGVTSQE